jgi:tRNA dimethylallyltransferase
MAQTLRERLWVKPRIVIITGPTGVGKSPFALELADRIEGEIIVADSMQVYRFMDIGTAKPTRAERAHVPHHLVDLVDPDEDFSAGQFQEAAQRAITAITEKNKQVVVCGGTGLYIKSLLRGLMSGPKGDKELRAELYALETRHGPGYLHARLRAVDPQAALRIHPHDTFRIVRALEVYHATGATASSHQDAHAFRECRYEFLQLGLCLERPLLYQRIETRCDRMVEEGLVDEVNALLARGYRPDLKSMQSLGYRHLCAFLQGTATWEEALAAMKRDTRHYAKRQLTWFRADPSIVWITPSPEECAAKEKMVKKFLFRE